MSLELSIKRGDAKLLTVGLGRNLTGVESATFLIAEKPGVTATVISRAGDIVEPRTDEGVVTLQLTPDDYGDGKLLAGTLYRGEVETLPGPLTHPDDGDQPYFFLKVLHDLNPPV